MAYDPREKIVELFTNEIVSGSTESVYGDDFVEIFIAERKPNWIREYNGAGVLILEEPIVGIPELMNIRGDLHKIPMTIQSSLWISNKKGLKNPDEFMTNIIDSFQKTIRTNRRTLIANGDVEGFGAVEPLKSTTGELFGKAMFLYAFKYE